MEESIYNLIPRTENPEAKGALYKSRFPHDIPPTGSTFGHQTTSRPGVSNLSGLFQLGLQAHTPRGLSATLGYLKHSRRSNPTNFTRKQTGTMGNSTLPPIRQFSYQCSNRKPSLPKEAPVMGLRSNRNFIVTNAVETIIGSGKKTEEKVDWLKKESFGKTPEYLERIKESIRSEYDLMRGLHDQNEQTNVFLQEEDILELRNGLKQRWTEVNHDYQKMTHLRIIDTTGLKNKKLSFERQLKQIEDDIRKLNKRYILVR